MVDNQLGVEVSEKCSLTPFRVAAFQGRTWAGAQVTASQISARELQIGVQSAGMSTAQRAIFSAATQRAQSMGVTLTVTPIP